MAAHGCHCWKGAMAAPTRFHFTDAWAALRCAGHAGQATFPSSKASAAAMANQLFPPRVNWHQLAPQVYTAFGRCFHTAGVKSCMEIIWSGPALELVPHDGQVLRELVAILGFQVALHLLQQRQQGERGKAAERADRGRSGGRGWCGCGHSRAAGRQALQHCSGSHGAATAGWGEASGQAGGRTSISFSRQADRCCCRSGIWLDTICCFSWP